MLVAVHKMPSVNNIKHVLFTSTSSWLAWLFWEALNVLAPIKFFVLRGVWKLVKLRNYWFVIPSKSL